VGPRPDYCCLNCEGFRDCCAKPRKYFCRGSFEGVATIVCGHCRPLSCFKKKRKECEGQMEMDLETRKER